MEAHKHLREQKRDMRQGCAKMMQDDAGSGCSPASRGVTREVLKATRATNMTSFSFVKAALATDINQSVGSDVKH